MRILPAGIRLFFVRVPRLAAFARPRLSNALAILAKRLPVPANPVENASEPELAAIHGAVDKLVSFFCRYLDVETVAPQEDVGRGEGDALVAVEEAVIVAQRLHQRRRFFLQRVVIAGLGTENRGLNRIL